MDYKEIKKKDGQVIVFCNFEDLLKDAFSVNTMAEVEAQKTPNDEYICHCPFCRELGHTKHKLYVKSDLTVGHCFVCTRSFVNVTDEVTTKYSLPTFFPSMYGNSLGGLNLVRLSDPTWSLDKYWTEFDDYSEAGLNYLRGRHMFMDQLWQVLDFKFIDDNIVMPFKYRGEIFYYQIRFSGASKIKYFFPPISAKPPYIIEHGENKRFIVCEGVYDAIALLIQAPEYTPFAVLGSSISDYQLDFLREYVPSEIVVYMDETHLSAKIARKIQSVIDYCPVRVIRSEGTDPEEKMQELIKWNRNLQWIKVRNDNSGDR